MSKNYRDLFYGIDEPFKCDDGTTIIPINFDNGATTPPMKCALKALRDNALTYGPIARGAGQKGDLCTKKYEEAREDILDFFNLKGDNNYTVIYTKTTTESLNILANVLIKNKEDKVLTTRMEHHANDLPWRHTATVEYIDIDKLGRINLVDIKNSLIANRGLVKYVSITGASNVTGYMNDIHEIAKLCHKYGAKIIVDAAQLVAHKEVNMKGNDVDDQIDFLVFSSHKAYSPFGSGAIVGLSENLSNVEPFLRGGGSVDAVFDNVVYWNTPPSLLEAGSPNFLGIMAMVAALKRLKKIGFDNIFNHEMEIKNYLISEMKNMPNVILYGDVENTTDRLGVITFNLKDMPYYNVSERLADEAGIATRYAKFCAHPYVNRLLGVDDTIAYFTYADINQKDIENPFGMVRVSLGLYNTMEEAEKFIEVLKTL
ncbi:MAG: aminotransferase class V-fold PLP-dependent enzyme [Peptostreptococcaceae bacterium]